MNHNYMNYFGPGSSGGMSGAGGGGGSGDGISGGNNGLDYTNQPNYLGANMPSSGGSFMDMITSGQPPPPMMNAPGHQMTRYNHPYSNMYGQAPYGMEGSAVRLQQFARQMTPRHGVYNMPSQNTPEQMSQYYLQKMQIRMAQINNFNSQRYNNNPMSWPRMMPHLPQLSPQQNRMNSMQMVNSNFNSELSPLRRTNMQNIVQQQSAASFRKMPVLDEAPPALRGQSPFPQSTSTFNTPQYTNQVFSSSNNSVIPTMTYSSDASSSLNMNTTNDIVLPDMNFSSPQPTQSQQPTQTQSAQQALSQQQMSPQVPSQQQTLQQKIPQQQQPSDDPVPNFLSSFTTEIAAPLAVPQSPKLTHFGPSPGSVSSPRSFEASQASLQQASQQNPLQSQTQLLSTVSLTTGTPTVSNTSLPPFSPQSSQQNLSISPHHTGESKPPQLSNNAESQQYFLKMASIHQQINQLKQGVQSPEKLANIQILNQKYQLLYKQYEASKQQIKMPELYSEHVTNKQQPHPPLHPSQMQLQGTPQSQLSSLQSEKLVLLQQATPQLQQPQVSQRQQSQTLQMQQPQPPQMQQSATSRMQQPLTPQLQQPLTPQMQQPTTPQMQQPLTPQLQQPLTPQMQQPLTPQLQQPTTPLMQQPLTPQMQQPLTPQMQPQPQLSLNLQQQQQQQRQTTLNQNHQQQNQQTNNISQQMKNQLPQYHQALHMPLLPGTDLPKQQPISQPPKRQESEFNKNPLPTLPDVKPTMESISNSSLLDEIGDSLNIPDLDTIGKDFLNDDSKSSSLFSAAFFGNSDLLFGSDSLDAVTGIKTEDSKKNLQDQITLLPQLGSSESKTFQDMSSTTTVLSSGDQKNVFPGDNVNNQNIFTMQPNSGQQMFQAMQTKQSVPPFPFNQSQFSSQFNTQVNNQIPPNMLMSMSNLFSKNIPSSANMSRNMIHGKPMSMTSMSPAPVEPQKQKGVKSKGKSGKGSGKSSKGKAGRPPGSLNKKKKDEKPKKTHVELEPDDFDNIAPGEIITKDMDESLMDPSMRRSLRERTKKKNYKDDFDYNLSEEEDGKKEVNVSKDPNTGEDESTAAPTAGAPEPAIAGGANQLLAYRPNLEVEGEIAIIEKILAMRSTQKEEVKEENSESTEIMVEEFCVKYKGYSYLHCEWGTIEKLAKKDKRVYAKVKRYKQKRDTSLAYLNELDEEPFNPDYIEVDRVLDMQTTLDPVTQEKINHFLVKWRALPYEDSTWELQMNLDESIVQNFHELKKAPPEELRKFIPRPDERGWMKLNASPSYKNGNMLRDYQLEGLNWLTYCWYKRINCILADEMGLGKTVQSISLLCAMKNYGIRGPFLVIAPLSTIANWQREFEEWTDINAVVYHGSLNSRNCIQQYEVHYKDENNESINQIYKFEAIITTYEIVLSANTFLCTIPFRCLIIDEAHRLKNQKCKLMEGLNNLRMEHRVLLTGTPLQNNVEELFSLLNFLEPTRFPSQGAFMYEFGNLKTEAQVDKLKQILKPMMLRRLKEDVETNIASKEETIVEVELTTIQKKFYRAIMERNFSFLSKGTGNSNLPNLMNTMMELRKCCNHPFLIKGAEEKIVSEYLSEVEDPEKVLKQMKALIESSGKMVLIDKLLPKLKDGGHKVLIFSQMIKVLNLIEDYLVAKRYQFERIDGGVKGEMRQAAIDRFSRDESDRFVFLLCTRAGGLGINLTAADTVIIFDSDWNPQNDLQAQARCHRIGQSKPVKVYRLICRNTYEREMFDRASLKLGLDKAVLQNINAKEGASTGQQAMSKKEVEDLLKKGAYGAVMETDEDANKFCEEDIDQILERRTQIIQIKDEGKGSTFSKASFVSDKAGIDVDLDDPDFWKKWAERASVDIDQLEKDQQLIVDEPRKRKQTRRFGNDTDATMEMSDLDSDDETYEPHKGKSGKTANLGPIERVAWPRVECFKVEKLLLVYGWGRWQEVISHAHFRHEVRHSDIEALIRTILAYCFRYYKTDDRSKQFFIDLIDESVRKAPPKTDKLDITNQILGSTPLPKNARGRKRGGGSAGRNALRKLTHQYSKPALVECGADWQTIDAEQLIIDSGYRKHLQHHCSKIMSRVRFLYSLQRDIIKEAATPILDGKNQTEVEFEIPAVEGELPTIWWDEAADKSLLMGVFKHGYEKYRLIRNDPCLHFYHKLGPLQFNEKVPGSPDSFTNPASIERTEDGVSDPESVSSVKKKGKNRKDADEDDSLADSDEEKDMYSLTASPASVTSTKEATSAVELKVSNNPETRWPLPADLNTRLRRLFAAYTKSCDKEHLDSVKAEKDKIKQVRMANMVQERQRKRLEMQQRWTKREESDFYRVLSNFGVVKDHETKKHSWDRFRQLAKLEKKYDETLTLYFEEFASMCRKICGRASSEDLRRLTSSQIEEISEDRASKCLVRIKLLSRIRDEVLVHPKLNERIEFCQLSIDLPRWWKSGKHDKALLTGVAEHGLGRTEYQVLLDPDSVFKELLDNIPPSNKVKEDVMDTSHEQVNGEHPIDTAEVGIKHPGMDARNDSSNDSQADMKSSLPIHTNQYAQLLASWPKEKGIVLHLEKVCCCILKGEWPKPPKLDINPMVTKLPAFTRPLVSTVGHFTSAEATSNEKLDGLRGEVEASSRDFKVKSIDGLKLTVKTDSRNLNKFDPSKRRKRKLDSEQDAMSEETESQSDREKAIVKKLLVDPSHNKDDVKGLKKKKMEDSQKISDSKSTSDGIQRAVQIHIPKTVGKVVSSAVINAKISKVSTIMVSNTSRSSDVAKHTVSVLTKSGSRSVSAADRKPTVAKVVSEPMKVRKASSITDIKIPKAGDQQHQPLGIHIDSPNANVRIQGSKIEVKEKSNIKREIDLSEVILKVPDPSRFMTTKDTKKKIVKQVKTIAGKPPAVHTAVGKPPVVQTAVKKPTGVPTSKPCEHKKEMKSVQQSPKDTKKPTPPPTTPVIRRRPERSAKKKAKDSISEITEAEHRPISKVGLRDPIPTPLSPPPPHREWREMRSPPPSSRQCVPTRDYYTDYYSERSPQAPRRSPDVHHRHIPQSRSPPHYRRVSSPDRPRSPLLHTIHGRPLSPVRRHHSPPPHLPSNSPHLRDHHDEHLKHLHYTEPHPPRYRGERDSPYFYSDRSRSPYYYDYRHDKERYYEELERHSPPIKHRRLKSPIRELVSPGGHHKHPGFIHVPSEALSPVAHRKPQSHTPHDSHSPKMKEGRFPYGRTDWESPRYHHDGIHSPTLRSSPVDSQFQYQPLSRMTSSKDDGGPTKLLIKSPPSRERIEHRGSVSYHERRDSLTVTSPRSKTSTDKMIQNISRSSTRNRTTIENLPARKRTTDDQLNQSRLYSPPLKKPSTAEYHPSNVPKDDISDDSIPDPSTKKTSKPIVRPVIEIPEETARTPVERKTPTRKKGILEMKIQGLKSKMQQSGISDKIKEKMDTIPPTSSSGQPKCEPANNANKQSKDGHTKSTKSLSDVINSLSSGNENKSQISSSEVHTKTEQSSQKSSKRTKSLADITLSLTKSLEKTHGGSDIVGPKTVDRSRSSMSEYHSDHDILSPVKGKSSSSKLSDVISTLKEKSKAASSVLPESKFKDVTLSRPTNDSKLLDMLKQSVTNRPLRTKGHPASTPEQTKDKLYHRVKSPPERMGRMTSPQYQHTNDRPDERRTEDVLSPRLTRSSSHGERRHALPGVIQAKVTSPPPRLISPPYHETHFFEKPKNATSPRQIKSPSVPRLSPIIPTGTAIRKSRKVDNLLATKLMSVGDREHSAYMHEDFRREIRKSPPLHSPEDSRERIKSPSLRFQSEDSRDTRRSPAMRIQLELRETMKSPPVRFPEDSRERIKSPSLRFQPEDSRETRRSPAMQTYSEDLRESRKSPFSGVQKEKVRSPVLRAHRKDLKESIQSAPLHEGALVSIHQDEQILMKVTKGTVKSPSFDSFPVRPRSASVISVPVLRKTPTRRSSLTSPPPLIKSPPPLIKSPSPSSPLMSTAHVNSSYSHTPPLPLMCSPSLRREDRRSSPHVLRRNFHNHVPEGNHLDSTHSSLYHDNTSPAPTPSPSVIKLSNVPEFKTKILTIATSDRTVSPSGRLVDNPESHGFDAKSPEFPKSPPIISTEIASTSLVKPTAVIANLLTTVTIADRKPSGNITSQTHSESLCKEHEATDLKHDTSKLSPVIPKLNPKITDPESITNLSVVETASVDKTGTPTSNQTSDESDPYKSTSPHSRPDDGNNDIKNSNDVT